MSDGRSHSITREDFEAAERYVADLCLSAGAGSALPDDAPAHVIAAAMASHLITLDGSVCRVAIGREMAERIQHEAAA